MQGDRSPDLLIEDTERSLAEHPMMRRDSKVVSTSSPHFNKSGRIRSDENGDKNGEGSHLGQMIKVNEMDLEKEQLKTEKDLSSKQVSEEVDRKNRGGTEQKRKKLALKKKNNSSSSSDDTGASRSKLGIHEGIDPDDEFI